MIKRTFALGSYEFELQHESERKYILDTFQDCVEYIDTAVDYNNDYLLKDAKYKIISKLSFCHYNDYEFFVSNHLKCLDRDYIDIMLIHSNRGNWKNLAVLINNDTRFKEVGVSNFNKEDILEYKELIGEFPVYNEIEINPYYLDIDTISFCKANNIKIIAYAILGGKYNSWRNVADFGLPTLVSFAASYADIVIIRPNSIKEAYEFKDTILHYKVDEDINISIDTSSKSIEPMNYRLPTILKTYLGKPTYHTSCGQNTLPGNEVLTERSVPIVLPEFEMLGDYKVYLRYKYRQDYSNKKVYDYDFLIGDDGKYYVVYLWTKDGNLTKVNHNSNIEVRSYEVQSI